MIYYWLIYYWCSSFILETQGTDILTEIKQFHVHAAALPEILNTYNEFLRNINLNGNEMRTFYKPGPNSHLSEDGGKHVDTICEQIGYFIDAIFLSARHRSCCIFGFENLGLTMKLYVQDTAFPWFLTKYIKNSELINLYPFTITLDYASLPNVMEYKNFGRHEGWILYNAERNQVHFETRFGLLSNIKKFRKELRTFGGGAKDLTRYLMMCKQQDDFIAMRPVMTYEKEVSEKYELCEHLALYVGAINVGGLYSKCYFYFPTIGIELNFFYGGKWHDDGEHHKKYYFENSEVPPVHVYIAGGFLSNGIGQILYEVLQDNMFYYDLKHLKCGLLKDYDYGSLSLKKFDKNEFWENTVD